LPCACSSYRCLMRCGLVRRGLLGPTGVPPWNDDAEGRPASRRAHQLDPAAEQRGERARQTQSETAAVHAPLQAAVDLRELLEDALLIRGRDADAGVPDIEAHRVSDLDARRHADLAALGELDGVRQQVAQNL